MKTLSLYCLLGTLLLNFSCTKELCGPALLLGNKNRTLCSFTVNGADSLSRVDPHLRESGALRFKTYISHTDLPDSRTLYIEAGFPVVLYSGTLCFSDHCRRLKFGHTYAYMKSYPFTIADGEWEITEVQDSEVRLRMKNYQNDMEYIMEWK